VPDATFAFPDVTTFCRLDELGLEVVGQRLEPDRAVLACRVVDDDGWCRRCGCQGAPRDSVVRRLAHEASGLASHDAGSHGPLLPVRRVRARVATGHQQLVAPGVPLWVRPPSARRADAQKPTWVKSRGLADYARQ